MGFGSAAQLDEWNPFRRKMRRERMMKAAAVSQPLAKLRRRQPAEESSDLPSEEFISKQVDPILDKHLRAGASKALPNESAGFFKPRAPKCRNDEYR